MYNLQSMNIWVFRTDGDWDSATLHCNGVEFLAAQLFLELHTGRDEYGDPYLNGISMGGEIEAIARPQAAPDQTVGLFPGRVEIYFPGHSLVIENAHPAYEFLATRVWYNGQDVTSNILDVYVDINAVDDIVSAYITLYKAHWFGPDEIMTITIF